MHWSKLFIPTLRDDPAEAEVASHKLLLRAGYIRQLAAGIYSHLFLAQRSLLKITAIVREEMDAIGAQEFHLPALNPAEVWQESGRWDAMGDNLFRLKDRFGRPLCLAMTHEEVMTTIARGLLRSYKQLPQIWYQIQTKFRDEPRPKSGLLRVRQFIMKDSYSFDMDAAGLDVSYEKHRAAYCRIFERCGLDYMVVERARRDGRLAEFGTDAGEDSWCAARTTRPIWRKPSAFQTARGSRSGGRSDTRRVSHAQREDIAGRLTFAGNIADEEPGDGGGRGSCIGPVARRSSAERGETCECAGCDRGARGASGRTTAVVRRGRGFARAHRHRSKSASWPMKRCAAGAT